MYLPHDVNCQELGKMGQVLNFCRKSDFCHVKPYLVLYIYIYAYNCGRCNNLIINKLYHHVFNSLVFIYLQVRHRFITHILYIICKPNPSIYK